MRRKDVPFHGGEGGNIYRSAYIIVYKLNQGSRRRNDVLFHRGGEGRGETCGRKRRTDVPFHRGGGGGKHISLCLYILVYKLNQGSRRRNDVLFHRGGRGRGETCGRKRRTDVPFHRGGGGKTYIAMPIYTCI